MALAIADRIKPATQIPTGYGINLLLFGASRSGKTTLAASANEVPEMRDVLILAAEDGLASVTNLPHVSYVPVKTQDDIFDIYDYIEAGDHPFKTIVVDSLSAVANVLMRATEDELGHKPEGWEYAVYNDKVKGFVRSMRQLCSAPDKGYNVIFTSMTKEKRTKSKILTALGPDLSEGLNNGVVMHIDGIGYLYVNEEGQRVLSFEQTEVVYAGYRQPKDAPPMPLTFVDPSMADIYKHAVAARKGVIVAKG